MAHEERPVPPTGSCAKPFTVFATSTLQRSFESAFEGERLSSGWKEHGVLRMPAFG